MLKPSSWVGRDLCGSSSPKVLPKQGHLEQAAQDRIQAGLEYLQRKIHNLPGQPGPGLRPPQMEDVLPHVQMELLTLQFVPVAPCPVTGHHWKESGPILLTPTLQIFISIYKVPSQPSPGWTSPAPSAFLRWSCSEWSGIWYCVVWRKNEILASMTWNKLISLHKAIIVIRTLPQSTWTTYIVTNQCNSGCVADKYQGAAECPTSSCKQLQCLAALFQPPDQHHLLMDTGMQESAFTLAME